MFKEIDFIEVWNDFRKGDKEAFSILFSEFHQELFRYGMKFTLNEDLVKDCIQDLYVKIYNNRDSLSSTSNPKFYLLTSIKNLIIDALLKEKRNKALKLDDLPFVADYSVEDSDDYDLEIKEKLNLMIGLLSARQKEAIYLRFHQGLSYKEISELLNLNYQSVKNLIHRSILKIREAANIRLDLIVLIIVISVY